MHTANIEIRECIKWSPTRSLKKCRKIINHQAQKVVAVAYRRWSFTWGSNFNTLNGKILVFWIGSCLWEMVAYARERWPHMQVRLYHETSREDGKQVNIHKKGNFFPFRSLNTRVILKKASSFCINFLLLCVLCVYFAPYTLKKSHPFKRLSVNIF